MEGLRCALQAGLWYGVRARLGVPTVSEALPVSISVRLRCETVSPHPALVSPPGFEHSPCSHLIASAGSWCAGSPSPSPAPLSFLYAARPCLRLWSAWVLAASWHVMLSSYGGRPPPQKLRGVAMPMCSWHWLSRVVQRQTRTSWSVRCERTFWRGRYSIEAACFSIDRNCAGCMFGLPC
jgi:hypothetical protein